MAQVVTGGPEGLAAPGAAAAADSDGATVRTVLTVDGGRLTLIEDPTGTIAANVTMVLTYDDALAIAAGRCTGRRPGGRTGARARRVVGPGRRASGPQRGGGGTGTDA